jgi:hypothetical protein
MFKRLGCRLPEDPQVPLPAAAPENVDVNRPEGSVIGSNCWSCDALQSKRVARRNLEHRHFTWSCHDCDVAWRGPGRLLSAG